MKRGALRAIGAVCLGWAGCTNASAEIDLPAVDLLSGGFQADGALYYSGFDIWRNGYAGFSGIEASPLAVGDDGLLLRLTAFDGIDLYQTPKVTYRTQTLSSALMAGWRFKRCRFEIKALAGIDTQARIQLNPTLAWIERLHSGLRVAAEMWWEPSEIVMLSAALSLTTNTSGRTARVAAGYRLLDQLWIGPELAVASDLYSTQYRAGVHLTGLRLLGFEWSAATGYVADSFNRGGLYGRLVVSTGRGSGDDGLLINP